MATSKKTTKAKTPKKAVKAKTPKKTGAKTAAKAEKTTRSATRAKAASAPAKLGPAPDEPVWVKPMTTPRVQIQLPDGSIATQKVADDLAVWPSARLRIVFGEGINWYGKAGTDWHKQAIAMALKLASLAKPAWIVHDVIDRWDVPALKPVSFAKAEAEKLLGRTLFRKDMPDPWTEMRTGDERGVRYDRSLLALREAVELHLPPTPENVDLLERTLDDLDGSIPFAWAGVGYGLSGWSSDLALTKDKRKVTPVRGSQIRLLEDKSAVLGADWLVVIGGLWHVSPSHTRIVEELAKGPSRAVEQGGSLTRISVPRPESVDDAKGAKAAKKLAQDLKAAAKKIRAVEDRALLRKLDRKEKR
jgi:hypothetical protein